jgi:hypothetical protein
MHSNLFDFDPDTAFWFWNATKRSQPAEFVTRLGLFGQEVIGSASFEIRFLGSVEITDEGTIICD